jgi:predicted acyltransferase (DUF342 family)
MEEIKDLPKIKERVDEVKDEEEFAYNKLIIPPNTKFEERNIVVEKDIVVGAGCNIGYGLMGRKVIVGEKTTVAGDVVGDEIRLDSWNTVKGNVICKGDAYIGEFTTIEGRLTVFGDLEIGRNVKLKSGFEAKGLITIQDPLPVLIFLFLYLLELLRLGRLEEAEKLFEVVDEIESPLVIPENSNVNLETIQSNSDFEAVGSRILGNIRVKNLKAEGCEIFGSIRAKNISVDGCRVHGSIEGKDIYLINGSEVYGAVKGERIFMEDKCSVESSIIGKSGVWIKRQIELPDRSITQILEDTERKAKEVVGKIAKVEVVVEEESKREGDEVKPKKAKIKRRKSKTKKKRVRSGRSKRKKRKSRKSGVKGGIKDKRKEKKKDRAEEEKKKSKTKTKGKTKK